MTYQFILDIQFTYSFYVFLFAELLYDVMESHTQHKWETLESISGTYDQDIVNNEMAELKFERPVHIKARNIFELDLNLIYDCYSKFIYSFSTISLQENTRYAIRLCSQGARTCSGTPTTHLKQEIFFKSIP